MNDIEEAISYIENTKKHLLHLGETWYADYLDDAIDLLKEQETKHGEWIDIWREDDPDTSSHARCSVCNLTSARPVGAYCKWCGAKMDSEGR